MWRMIGIAGLVIALLGLLALGLVLNIGRKLGK